MKKYIYIALLAVVMVGCARRELAISGKIANLPDQTAYLRTYDGAQIRIADSSAVSGGAFSFMLPDTLPDMYYITFSQTGGLFIPLIAEGLPLTVTGDVNRHEDITVEGSPSNSDLTAYRAATREHQAMLRAIENLIAEGGMDKSTLAYYTARCDSLTNLTTQTKRDFVAANPSSIVSAYLATTMPGDSTLVALDPDMADNIFLHRLNH